MAAAEDGTAPDVGGASAEDGMARDVGGAPAEDGMTPDMDGASAEDGMAQDMGGAPAERGKEELERRRAEVCARLAGNPGEELLWEAILLFQGYPLRTSGRGSRPGVLFTYTVKARRDGKLGGEIAVDRKEKTITQSSVFMAYQRALELGGDVGGPKKLGVFGASYLYPIFQRLGIIRRDSIRGQQRLPDE